MKFGKLENCENIKFALNPLTFISTGLIGVSESKFYMGGTAWGNSEWKGTLYPSVGRQENFLKYYQQQLDTIELNTTFYRIPDTNAVSKWREQVSGNFKFCPKIPLLISRTKDIERMKYYIDEFTTNIRHFDDHLGPCFIQWPEYADLSFFEIFESFADAWPSDLEISMEFRHKDCFSENSLQVDLLSLLEEKSIDSVITDVAGRRDAAHNTVINGNILIRFVSSGNLGKDYGRLRNWKQIIDEIPKSIHYRVYFFVHEGENSQNAELTIYTDQLFNNPQKIKLYHDNINTSGKNQTSLF